MYYNTVLTVSPTPTEPPVSNCSNGDVSLTLNRTFSDGQFESVGGYLEICVDRQFIAVCGNDTTVDLNVTHLVEVTCQQLGYG